MAAADARAAAARLVALLGAGSTALVLTLTPLEESGRKVEVAVFEDRVAITHVSGKQYLKAYLDAVGVPTACDGITRKVRMGMTFTEAQCAEMLVAELLEVAQEVKRCSPGLFAAGMQHARVAAVLLAYNVGWPKFCGSTANRLFRAGATAKACDAFLPWNKGRVKGKLTVLPGLVKRRARERQVCLTGTPGFPPATLDARLKAAS